MLDINGNRIIDVCAANTYRKIESLIVIFLSQKDYYLSNSETTSVTLTTR